MAPVNSRSCRIGRQGPLAWVRMHAAAPNTVVFAPPLIGGGAANMIRRFRWLGAAGAELFSFDYAGHGRSAGAFSLTASLRNTRRLVRVAEASAARRGLSVSGLGVCYGAIPLLYAAAVEIPIRRIVLLNPIPGFSVQPLAASFRQWAAARPGMKRRAQRYLDALFPFTNKGLDGFGTLARRRTRLLTVLGEALRFDPLRRLRLDGTRLLCLYATDDIIRSAAGYGCEVEFRRRIRSLCPGAEFHPIEDDHYLSRGGSRRRVRALVSEFLSAPAA